MPDYHAHHSSANEIEARLSSSRTFSAALLYLSGGLQASARRSVLIHLKTAGGCLAHLAVFLESKEGQTRRR